jgi:hypothetical protein
MTSDAETRLEIANSGRPSTVILETSDGILRYVLHLCKDDYPIYCTLGKFISQTFELLIGVHLTGMHLLQACISYRHASLIGMHLLQAYILEAATLHPDIHAT